MSAWAFSDLHGNLKLFEQIKGYIKPEDTLYCLGDCGDRGPKPWETIKTILRDPQVDYIKGNHDDMLIKAVREALDENGWRSENQRLLACNGGYDTLCEVMDEENPKMWISELAQKPTYTIYTNSQGQDIFLCHAGCSLWKDDDSVPTAYKLMWDRLHYFDNANLMRDDIIICHGHTPINHIALDLNLPFSEVKGALRYADGKKYCIDAGTYRTGKAILFNLDTFESIVFNSNDYS